MLQHNYTELLAICIYIHLQSPASCNVTGSECPSLVHNIYETIYDAVQDVRKVTLTTVV